MKKAALFLMLLIMISCATIQPRVVCSWFSEYDFQLKTGKNITVAVVGEKGIPYAATKLVIESEDGLDKQEQITSLDGKAVFRFSENHNVYKIKFKTWCQNQYYHIEKISLDSRENTVVLIIKLPNEFCPEGIVE